MGLYERVADLTLRVDDVEYHRQERETPGFTRVTTTVALSGGSETGRGEDVTYEAAAHDALAADPPALPTGSFRFAEFSAALADVDLFPDPPAREHARHYRRWAFESAALDLALRQAATNLGAMLGRTYDPVRFVASTRLGDDGFERIERLLLATPTLEFKLDPAADWDEELVAELADTDRVRVLDLKGHYKDADVGTAPDPDLYRLVLESFPDAVVEDPAFTEATRPVLAGHEDRLSWDAPITGVDAVAALPVDPAWLNVKPSRFGTVASLFAFLEHCEAEGIQLYGGGQFELGVGREQVQALASLFYPDGPNDVAPTAYNDPEPSADLPASPLRPQGTALGLGWR